MALCDIHVGTYLGMLGVILGTVCIRWCEPLGGFGGTSRGMLEFHVTFDNFGIFRF